MFTSLPWDEETELQVHLTSHVMLPNPQTSPFNFKNPPHLEATPNTICPSVSQFPFFINTPLQGYLTSVNSTNHAESMMMSCGLQSSHKAPASMPSIGRCACPCAGNAHLPRLITVTVLLTHLDASHESCKDRCPWSVCTIQSLAMEPRVCPARASTCKECGKPLQVRCGSTTAFSQIKSGQALGGFFFLALCHGIVSSC